VVASSSAPRGSRHVEVADRRDAGRRLATLLGDYRYGDPVVVGNVSDGLPVAAEVARALGAPVHGAPATDIRADGHVLGVVAEGATTMIEEQVTESPPIGPDELAAALGRARRELRERLACCCSAGRRVVTHLL
jgi:predicted phosphoribosyltransferase